jgi:DNA-directed RNA polymerase subunit RPC12/RpoP
MVVIFPGGDNGIQVNIYAPMSMAITRSGEIALLVTGQYLTCGDCGSIVNTKGRRTTVKSGKP